MDKGTTINFGAPYDLLQDKNSVLFSLVNSLKPNEAQKLTEIAKMANKEKQIKNDLKQICFIDEEEVEESNENENLLNK